jgi:hypothetical protein
MRPHAVVVAGIVVGLLSCHEAAGPGPFSLALQETRLPPTIRLSAALRSDTLALIVLHDTSAAPDTVAYGMCAFAARIYNGSGYSHLAWQSVPSGATVCAMAMVSVVVPGHDSASLIAARIAPSPPDVPTPPSAGQVRSCINANGTLVELVAGIRDLPFGTAAPGEGSPARP